MRWRNSILRLGLGRGNDFGQGLFRSGSLTTQTSGATAVRASTSRSVSGLKSADFRTSGITAVLKAVMRKVYPSGSD